MNLEFLNENSGAFAVIFSGLVAIATMVYAILTWRLVKETRKLRQAQTEPNVSITTKSKEESINFVDMVIQNIGLGSAYNITFKINPDFEYRKGMFLSELNIMKNGIKYLAPNQKSQFFLTSMLENFKEKVKKPFEIKVTYQNSIGNIYEDMYLIDFSQLVGLIQLGEPSLYKIAKNIENIRRDINHLSTGFRRMKVITYTKEDVEGEKKQFSKQTDGSRKKE